MLNEQAFAYTVLSPKQFLDFRILHECKRDTVLSEMVMILAEVCRWMNTQRTSKFQRVVCSKSSEISRECAPVHSCVSVPMRVWVRLHASDFYIVVCLFVCQIVCDTMQTSFCTFQSIITSATRLCFCSICFFLFDCKQNNSIFKRITRFLLKSLVTFNKILTSNVIFLNHLSYIYQSNNAYTSTE